VQSGTTYTFVATDVGKIVQFTSGSAVTATINTGIFNQGDTVGVEQNGAGQVTLAPGSGVTINSTKTLKTFAQNAIIGFVCDTTSTTFTLTGDRA
jgi:hypothetical protein